MAGISGAEASTTRSSGTADRKSATDTGGPAAKGSARPSFLNAIFEDPLYEDWYRRIWSFVATRFIDREHGGWRAQLDDSLRPNSGPFFGKVDIYHSLQACLIPSLPTTGSITRGLLQRFGPIRRTRGLDFSPQNRPTAGATGHRIVDIREPVINFPFIQTPQNCAPAFE